MTDANEWRGRTGDNWAAQWRRTDRSFGPLTEHLLQRSREFSFSSVLDIGCGAGEMSLALARGRPHVQVTGIDISTPLVAAARERSANLTNLSFELADAAVWEPSQAAPDFLVSRHGVMFFEDPVRAFTHLASVAAAGAGLLFSCFRDPADNPIFTEVGRLLPQAEPPNDPHAPGPFAFSEQRRVEGILQAAGWDAIACESYDFAMIAGAGADPVTDAVEYFTAIGPAARAVSTMATDPRERFQDRVRRLAERHLHAGIVSLRAGVWIVTARSSRS